MDTAVSNELQNAGCQDLKAAPSPATSESNPITSTSSGSGGPGLQSRSPFQNTMTHSNVQQRSAHSSGQVHSLPLHLHTAELCSSSVNQTLLPQRAHLSKSDDAKLSSRGVFSYQPGSRNSSDQSATSSLSYSEYGSYDGAPADPHTSGMYGTNSSHPGISGVNGRPHVGGVGAYTGMGQAPSHASSINGAELQGQGYFYPQQSQHQQIHYSSVPSVPTYSGGGGNNWMRNERVLHPGIPYQPQHMQPLPQHISQQNYNPQAITPHANSHIPIQGQYFSHPHGGGQSATMGGATGNYHMQQHQVSPYYQSHGPIPTYQHHHPSSSFYSDSFGSSNPASYNVPNYSHTYGGLTRTNAPKAPLPSHASTSGHSSSAQSSYNVPQNGYAPNAIPYHPLSSYTSASSSPPPSNAPRNGYVRDTNPPSIHAIAQPQSPEAQGQPVHGQHSHQHPQPGFTSPAPLSGVPTNKPSSFHESKAEHRHPISDASSSDDSKRQFHDEEEKLVGSLEKLKLRSHELPSPSKQSIPSGKKLDILQGPATQRTHTDDDNESVCTSILSGPLSRVEEFDDKSHFLEDPSIEITLHPQDCEVARNGRVELTCKARLINSKLEEEPLYLWYKDGEPLVGEISSECVLEEVGAGEEGQYLCVISHPNGRCSKQTKAAQVTLKTGNDARAPVLTHQPEPYMEAVKGEPLVLTIEAEGESPMSYTWFKGAQKLKYCSGNTLRVASASTLDNGQYCCTVSNEYGSVLSDVVVVKVVLQCTPLPPITSYNDEPSDDKLWQFAGLVARQIKNWARLALYLGLLPADAANSQHYQASKEQRAYQLLREWRKRKQGTLYALRTILTQAGVNFDSSQKTSSHSHTPSFSSSQPASLSISSQPRDVTVVYGQEARLEVRTERTDFSTTYQWYKNDRRLPGKTDKQLIIASTIDSDEGSYKCQISTSEGSIMSHAATIKVVSVAPQPQRPSGGYVREQRHNTRHRASGMYGLTGRGVDDDNFDDDRSQPVRIATPSTTPSTEPSTTAPAVSGSLQITEHPLSQVVPRGSPVTLSCRATTGSSSSSDNISYVWYMNGLSLIEDTRPDYHIASMTEEDEGMYSCEVSTLTHSLMSRMASLSLAV